MIHTKLHEKLNVYLIVCWKLKGFFFFINLTVSFFYVRFIQNTSPEILITKPIYSGIWSSAFVWYDITPKREFERKDHNQTKKNIFATDLFWIQINFDHRKADDTPKSNQINRINSKRKQSHRKRSFIHIFVFCRHSPKLAKMLTNKLPEEVDTLLSKGQIPIIDLAHCGEYFLD